MQKTDASIPSRLSVLPDLLRRALDDRADPARAAQSFLLPRSAHPTALRDQFGWLNGHPATPTDQAAILRVLRGARRARPVWSGDPLPDRAGLLVLSHHLGGTEIGPAQDDYFGSLVTAQAPSGPTVVARLNHSWDAPPPSYEPSADGAPARVVFARGVPLLRGVAQMRALRRAGRQIARLSPDRRLAAFIRAQSRAGPNLFAMGLATQVAALVTRLQPSAMILTWEGHAWERLVMQAARQAAPGIVCLAYHHTVLFPAQTATGRALGHGFDPDAILAPGQRVADWYAACPDWRGLPVQQVGSPRGAAARAPAPAMGPGLLVAPEGILEETVLLFETALRAKAAGLAIPVALRLHPVLPKARVIRALPALAQLPDGVAWSDGPLDAAFAQARCLLYRGSTVAIQALQAGVRPIYLQHGTGLPTDPLDPIGPWRITVVDAADLNRALTEDAAQPDAARRARFDETTEVANQIFAPPNPAALETLLAALCAR